MDLFLHCWVQPLPKWVSLVQTPLPFHFRSVYYSPAESHIRSWYENCPEFATGCTRRNKWNRIRMRREQVSVVKCKAYASCIEERQTMATKHYKKPNNWATKIPWKRDNCNNKLKISVVSAHNKECVLYRVTFYRCRQHGTQIKLWS